MLVIYNMDDVMDFLALTSIYIEKIRIPWILLEKCFYLFSEQFFVYFQKCFRSV